MFCPHFVFSLPHGFSSPEVWRTWNRRFPPLRSVSLMGSCRSCWSGWRLPRSLLLILVYIHRSIDTFLRSKELWMLVCTWSCIFECYMCLLLQRLLWAAEELRNLLTNRRLNSLPRWDTLRWLEYECMLNKTAQRELLGRDTDFPSYRSQPLKLCSFSLYSLHVDSASIGKPVL